MTLAFVTGCSAPALTDQEVAFIREANPFGLILFRRNIVDAGQVLRLTEAFRDIVGRAAPVLVDQEGGRVQRLSEPNWRRYPSARRLRAAAHGDPAIVRAAARLMAHDLRAVGISVDCMPSLDLGLPGQSDVIGDRAYSDDPMEVAIHGRAAAEGLLCGGVLPVIKHIPGHGRATVDSHHALPVVDAPLAELEAMDFAPFRMLSDLPAAMTAHVVYEAIDPEHPATQSSVVIHDIIRGTIGFDGLLFSDDLSMNALAGTLQERTRLAIAAGCDVALHCNGDLREMEQVASASRALDGAALRRADLAMSRIGNPDDADVGALLAQLDRALSALGAPASA